MGNERDRSTMACDEAFVPTDDGQCFDLCDETIIASDSILQPAQSMPKPSKLGTSWRS